MIAEITAVARRQVAEVGAAGLSLRAVAREMGMASSAVYRYFPSRDELLTRLIIDGYDDLGAAAEAADEPSAPPADRWLAVCRAVRTWALTHPHEYALLYGSPVPAYRAPEDTTEPATRPVRVLTAILADGVASGALRVRPGERLPRSVRDEFARVRAVVAPSVPEPVLARGMAGWVQLFGTVTFEVFGRFNNTIVDRAAFFDHQMRAMADQIGLSKAVRP